MVYLPISKTQQQSVVFLNFIINSWPINYRRLVGKLLISEWAIVLPGFCNDRLNEPLLTWAATLQLV